VILALDKGTAKAPPVEVRWSDGLRELFNNLQAERYHLLVRGQGEQLGE